MENLGKIYEIEFVDMYIPTKKIYNQMASLKNSNKKIKQEIIYML